MTSPCHNCSDRNAFCHTSCERYKVFREAKDRENEKKKKISWLENSLDNNEVERTRRMKKR